MMTLLEKGLADVGIDDHDISPLAEKMERYINEIILFNSAYNLTNTSSHDELVARHILDSLAAYRPLLSLVREREEAGCMPVVIGDIGSGGGLPGIPLAAAFPEKRIVLVERMEKRCAFLENCVAVLSLKNVQVLKAEAERLSPGLFDIVTFRAFRPLDEKITRALLRLARNDGALAAYKAKMQSINDEMTQIKELVPEWTVEPLSVPGLEASERNLVIIRK